MKTTFAKVLRISVIAFLADGREVEADTYPEDVPYNNIKWDRAEMEARFGKINCVSTRRIYDTPSGELEPGCMFWVNYPEKMFWDNHVGPHLHVVLPNGHNWNIDSRASNCTMPEDRLHRCWCRHGEVPNITVDKIGLTCAAGAGSIQCHDYHGFLRGGEFT